MCYFRINAYRNIIIISSMKKHFGVTQTHNFTADRSNVFFTKV